MLKDTQSFSTEELFGKMSTFDSIFAEEVGYEYYWRWPAEIGSGHQSMIKFRRGLVLAIGNYHLFKEVKIDFSTKNPYWVLLFNVGQELDSVSLKKKESDWEYRPGQISIVYQSELMGTVCLPMCSQVKTVGIYITPELLKSFVDPQNRSVLSDIHSAFIDNSQIYSQYLEMTPNISTTINQILNCPYQGAMNSIYLEGKTLELLTYSLSQFFNPEFVWKRNNNFSDGEIRQIHQAREIIGRDLQNPPKLQELAKAVGFSHTKLNQCFREIFGYTIFAYLRELRMHRAKSLLDSGCMNVTEVALEVGYSSLSHFARVFKEFHGILPSAYIYKSDLNV